MANNYFSFKQFTIYQDKSAFKVGTDSVLLGACADTTGVNRILDIGSGTGLLAIMLAQRSKAEIVTIEPDEDSYTQALNNVALCKWSNRIKVEWTTLQNFNAEKDKFDLIVTNPPFFSESLKNSEPRRSAARHNDSLSPVEILKGTIRLLSEDGRLQLIMPYVEGTVFIADAISFGLYCNNLLKIRPLPTSAIRRLILTFSRKKLKPRESYLTIEQGIRHEYTEEYINLTKEYYLNF